jgi:hypothetical protein
MSNEYNTNEVIQAIRNATNIQPKKTNKMKEACVHFFHQIPNSKEGWDFIKGVRKFINKDRYKVRVLGRGSRKEYGTQSFIPLKHATNYSVYIDHKIMDRNHPDFLSRKFYKVRSQVSELNNFLNQPIGE